MKFFIFIGLPFFILLFTYTFWAFVYLLFWAILFALANVEFEN